MTTEEKLSLWLSMIIGLATGMLITLWWLR